MSRILVIDPLTRPHHAHLADDDACYYFMNFTAHKGPTHSDANQLIYNFKKPVRYRGEHHYHYKGQAMRKVSELFQGQVIPNFNLQWCTLVPIPPSKAVDHPEYDDRMIRTLRHAFSEPYHDVRELIFQNTSMVASHESPVRPTVQELSENLRIDNRQLPGLRPNVLLFDDVITTGAHYVACRNLLLQTIPGVRIWGIFIARREVVFDFGAWDDEDV